MIFANLALGAIIRGRQNANQDIDKQFVNTQNVPGASGKIDQTGTDEPLLPEDEHSPEGAK